MDPQEKEANELVEKAKQIQTKTFYFGNRLEDSNELLTKAANKYKMAKNFEKAGETFKKIAENFAKLKSDSEAASSYCDASNCFRKGNMKEACFCLELAVNIYTTRGKFQQAARYEKELGELYEKENDHQNGFNHYEKAAQYFETENAKSSENNCLAKMGDLAVNLGKYEDAIKAYEKAAENALDDKLLSWGTKEYFFKCMICHLAKMVSVEENLEDIKNTFDNYKDRDVKFSNTRESNLIDSLIKAIEEKDVKKYQIALRDYDNISKLDNWKTSLFLTIKTKLEKEFTEESLQ